MGQSSAEHSAHALRERLLLLTGLSVIVGVAAGFMAYALYHLIGLITNLLFYGRLSDSFISPDRNRLGLLEILVPAFGGLLAGLMIKYGSTRIIGHGIPESMEAVLLSRSKIEPKVGVLKAVSAAVTIGSGQPFGAEGPIIQSGGAFGSFLGQIIPVTGSERRVLLAAGASAGMAAVFGTPISAVLLSIELLLFEFRVRSLIPVGIASAIGGWMHIYLITPKPLFETPAYGFGGIGLLPVFALLGAVCGLVGTILSKGLYRSEDLFRRLPFGQPWLPALGGLAVGAVGLAVPQILGVGYNIITDILSGRLLLDLVLMILIAKSVAWLFSMGSQTSGGTLAPFFMIGAALGFIYGQGVGAVLPGSPVPEVFALAAMGAVFGSAARAPFTSVVFTLEVTHDYNGVLPVIITVVVAELVSEYILKESLMTEKLARRGLHVRHVYEYNPLRQIKVSQIMSSPPMCADADRQVIGVYREWSSPASRYWKFKRLIVTSGGKPLGYISRDQVWQAAAEGDPELTVKKITQPIPVEVRADSYAYEAFVAMVLANAAFAAVTDGDGKVTGYLSQGDLLAAHRRKVLDETAVG
ncbi:MAG: chloride channel protein [Thermoprotei archaeon]